MDYIDSQIEQQIKQLEELQLYKEELQAYKTELQEINNKQEINIETNVKKIQKQVNDYIIYKSLKEKINPGICLNPNYIDLKKKEMMHKQLIEMEKTRRDTNLIQNMCINDYQLLLSETLIEIYKIINKK